MSKTEKRNNIERKTLPGGIKVLVERLPGVQTAAVGFWLPRGSRNERPAMLGGYHFVEHMMFKGTSRRTAKDIAVETESVGAHMNALTGKEYTCYYAKCLSEDLPLMVDVLGDMFFNSVFDAEEFDREKKVVLEEINNVFDTPEDFIFDQYLEDCFGARGLGHSVLGYKNNIEPMTRDSLFRMYRECYRTDELIIAIAGNVDGFDPAKLVAGAFDTVLGRGWRKGTPQQGVKKPYASGANKFGKEMKAYSRDIEQTHFVIGTKGFSYSDSDRYVLSILDMIFSGGMSSRLFQEVREKRGLVYDIYTATEFYKDTGIFTICAGTRPSNLQEVLEITAGEIRKVKAGDVSAEELGRVKRQLRAGIAMSVENPTGRMMKIGRSEIYFGRDVSDEQTLASIEAVSLDDVRRVANRMLKPGCFSASLIGSYKTAPQKRKVQSLVDTIFKSI